MAKVFMVTMSMTISRAVLLDNDAEVRDLTAEERQEIINEAVQDASADDPGVSISNVEVLEAKVVEV